MFRIFELIIAVLAFAATSAGEGLPDGAIRRIGGDAASDPLRGVYLVVYSPDGKLLATRSRDQIVRLWDTETGKERFELDGHEDRVTSLSFSRDGRVLATTSSGNNEAVRLWDTATGKTTQQLKHGGIIVQFLPDGQSLLVINSTKVIYYDAKSYEEKKSVPLDLSPSMTPLALSPDGKSLACYKSHPSGNAEFDVFVREIEGGVQNQLARLKASPVVGRFSPNGKQLIVSCRREESIHVFNLGDAITYGVRQAHDAQTQSIAFSPDGRLLATASWDNTVRLWDVLTDGVVATLSGHTEHVCAVTFSANGQRLASGASGPTDNSTLLWDVRRVLFGAEEEQSELTDEELSRIWQELALESTRAFRAMSKLICNPSESTPYIVNRVKDMVLASDAQSIMRLIVELDSDEFRVRESAHRKLIDLRVIAEAQLRKALEETDSFEVKSRIKQILAQTKSEKELTEAERRRIHRMIHAMELIGTQEMKQQLGTIASGFPNTEIIATARDAVDRLSAAKSATNEQN